MAKPSSKGFSRSVYPTARQKEIADEAVFDISISEIEKQLKPMIIELVIKSFRRYIKAHGLIDEKKIELECQRFKRILEGTL